MAIVVVGLPDRYESEGWDRADLALPADHDHLVDRILLVAPRTVVVLQNGAPVDLPWVDRPHALVEAWLGGQAGGSALADVLTGAVEPGGRLAESLPVDVSELPAHATFANHPTQVVHRETCYVGYRFFDTFGVAPRFPFGHGLGYTTWDWAAPRLEGSPGAPTVVVPLTNTGSRRGAQVVQIYVHPTTSALHRPEQELAGFAKITLEPGERAEVRIELDRRAFAVWDVASASWCVEAGAYEVRIGASSRDIRHTITLDVESDDVVQPVPAPEGPLATDEELAALLGHPVPAPRPLLPFHRDSLLVDLRETTLGRVVLRVLVALQRQMMPPPPDELTRRVLERGMLESPLRTLAAGVGGEHALRWVDRLVRLLNGARRG